MRALTYRDGTVVRVGDVVCEPDADKPLGTIRYLFPRTGRVFVESDPVPRTILADRLLVWGAVT